jgi:DNA-directed RNA polymerase subunit omega
MARLTVEDCLQNVDNRYDLVMLASKRARQIAMGAEPLVPANMDKPTVIALREIAENLINEGNIDKVNQFDDEDEFTEADFAIPTPAAPIE